MLFCQCSHIHKFRRPHWRAQFLHQGAELTGPKEPLHLSSGNTGEPDDGTPFLLTVGLPCHRFISFSEAVTVNSAIIYLMSFLVLLATVQLWNLLHHNPRLRVIDRTLSKARDEVMGFLLVILILLTGYAIAVSPLSQCLFLSAVVLESRCFP